MQVTFEEGTQAEWLYDLISPHATELVVCNPHHNHLLKTGNKSDRVDARKLAQLLRARMLRPVYHGEHGTRTLKELVRSYECLVEDTSRVKIGSRRSIAVEDCARAAAQFIKRVRESCGCERLRVLVCVVGLSFFFANWTNCNYCDGKPSEP